MSDDLSSRLPTLKLSGGAHQSLIPFPQKKTFLFLPCTRCDDPQRESTRSGLFGFPADMSSLKKTQNKHAENHKDKFGLLCGKAWSLHDCALTYFLKEKEKIEET